MPPSHATATDFSDEDSDVAETLSDEDEGAEDAQQQQRAPTQEHSTAFSKSEAIAAAIHLITLSCA